MSKHVFAIRPSDKDPSQDKSQEFGAIASAATVPITFARVRRRERASWQSSIVSTWFTAALNSRFAETKCDTKDSAFSLSIDIALSFPAGVVSISLLKT